MNTTLNEINNGKVIASTTIPLDCKFVEYRMGVYAHVLTNGKNTFIQSPDGCFVNNERVLSVTEKLHLDNVASVGIVYNEVKDGILFTAADGKYTQHVSKDRTVTTWTIGNDKIMANMKTNMYEVTLDGKTTSHVLAERALIVKLYEMTNKLAEAI